MRYIQYNWGNWLSMALLIFILYLVLQFVDRRLDKVNILGRYQERVHQLIRSSLLAYEPLALIILSVGFVLINPPFHGLGVGLLVLLGFNQLRNYINGRIVQFDKNIKKGAKVSVDKLSGVLAELGLFGLRIKNSQGLHFLNYSHVLNTGYLMHAGEQVGGYFSLKILAKEKEGKVLPREQIMDLFAATPYLDWNYKPEISYSKKNPLQLNARVSVKEKKHLKDLILLIDEWGYDTEIIKK